MKKTLTLLAAAAAALLAGCNADMYGPMPSGRDRTFSVPTRGNEHSLAYETANRECSRHGLFPKVQSTEPGRLVFECVSDRAEKP